MSINYAKYINFFIIAYAFVLPLSRAGISIFTILLMIVWVAEANFSEKFQILSNNKVVIAIFSFISLNFISLLWTDDVYSSLEYIRRYWYLLPMLVIMTSLKKEYIPKVLSAFILGMLISEIIAYGVFFELWEFKHATPDNPSPFMHHIEYSIFLAFTALVLLNRILNDGNFKSKLIYVFFFMTMSGNLFLTAGRTGQIAFILGLFVVTLMSFKNRFKAFIIGVFLTSILLSLAFECSETFNVRVDVAIENIVDVMDKKDYCSSWGSRVGAYITAKDIILENPIFGLGLSDNMVEFRQLVDTQYPEMGCIKELPHMHNQYLEILTQLGIVGLIIFLSILYHIMGIRLHKGEFYRMKYIYISVLSFALIPEVLLHRAFSLTLFALIVGLLLAQSRSENEIPSSL